MRGLCALFFSVFCLLNPLAAGADISEAVIARYNSAVTEGADKAAIIEASNALISEVIANPDEGDAAFLAYEAAAMLAQLGDWASALEGAKFVASAPVLDPAAHPVPLDRAVLAAFTAWQLDDNRQTRRALDEVLADAVDTEPNMISILAFELRYSTDLHEKRRRKAAISAGEAAHHIKSVADIFPEKYVTAQYLAAISLFNTKEDPEAMRQLVHLKGWLLQKADLAGKGAREWMRNMEYRASAWQLAMDAYFISTNRKTVRDQEVAQIMATYGYDKYGNKLGEYSYEGVGEEINSIAPSKEDSSEKLPFCDGQLNRSPRLKYPKDAGKYGRVGAVLAEVDLDETGQVIDPVVLASVPEGVFEKESLKAISKWKWIADETEQAGVTCRLHRKNLVQSFVFLFE